MGFNCQKQTSYVFASESCCGALEQEAKSEKPRLECHYKKKRLWFLVFKCAQLKLADSSPVMLLLAVSAQRRQWASVQSNTV